MLAKRYHVLICYMVDLSLTLCGFSPQPIYVEFSIQADVIMLMFWL